LKIAVLTSACLLLTLTMAGCGTQSNTSTQVSSISPNSVNSQQESPSPSSEPTVSEAEKAKLDEQQFKENTFNLVYNDVARQPDKFKSQKTYFVGKVEQVMEKNNDIVLRVNVTPGEYDIWEDTVWVNYTKPEEQDRILEEDIVQIWGTVKGLRTYEAIMGNEVSIPEINAAYITIGEPTAVVAEPQQEVITDVAEPQAQETVDPNASVKADSFIYEELYSNYENALIEAINAGDFSLVEYMLMPGSSLYRSQKALVENLHSRGITEELIDFAILDAQYNEDSGVILMTVKEQINVVKPDSESTVNSTWVYTVNRNDEGMFEFSKIEKA
jgi:hypothetical protein